MCGKGLDTNINLWLLFNNFFALTFTMGMGSLNYLLTSSFLTIIFLFIFYYWITFLQDFCSFKVGIGTSLTNNNTKRFNGHALTIWKVRLWTWFYNRVHMYKVQLLFESELLKVYHCIKSQCHLFLIFLILDFIIHMDTKWIIFMILNTQWFKPLCFIIFDIFLFIKINGNQNIKFL
jgi:hypothetical protein